ncbi:MAG: paraquat-inducible protein A [Gammaproteobacteria bacterium]
MSRGTRRSLTPPLAYTCAAIILFVIANLCPIVGLEFEGARNTATALGAVQALYSQDMLLLAALVLITTIAIPALDLGAMAYLLFAAQFGAKPPGLALILRLILTLKPWGMVEVFMLGILVALVKLAHMATVVPGIALWAFGGVMLLLALTAASFEPRDLWIKIASDST